MPTGVVLLYFSYVCLVVWPHSAASWHVKKAAARGFELEDIDADGDGNIDFQAEFSLNFLNVQCWAVPFPGPCDWIASLLQEFCTYFGRPNATYARTLAQANDSAKLNGNKMKMPMKQHVRIVGGHGRSVCG